MPKELGGWFSRKCAEHVDNTLKDQLMTDIDTVYFCELDEEVTDEEYKDLVRHTNRTLDLVCGPRRLAYHECKFRLFIDSDGQRRVVQNKDEIDL